ncbi:MAG: alpha/beta fold hydrolase [Balneolales bacterium]
MLKPAQTLFFLLALPALLSAQPGQGPDSLQLHSIFEEPYLSGVRPDFVSFSPDERRVYFHWNDSSLTRQKQYSVNLSGAGLKEHEDDHFSRFQLSPNGETMAFVRDGDIWIAGPDGSQQRHLVSSKAVDESPVWAPDSRSLAFVRDGDVWIAGIQTPGTRQLTQKGDDEPGYTIRHWTGDGKHIILSRHDTSGYWDLYYPEYVDKFVTPGKSRRGQAEVTVMALEVQSLSTRELTGGIIYLNGVSGNASGHLVAIDQMDAGLKNRCITVYDLQAETYKVVFEDETRGWINPQISRMDFAPGTDRLFFTSEQDGWSHIYTVQPDGSQLRQHSDGKYEISWAAWRSAETIIYASNEVDPGERHVYGLNLVTGEVSRYTGEEGYRRSFNLSPDRRYLVYEKTFWNEPMDLYILDLSLPRRGERPITNSVPKRFHTVNWQLPDYHRFTSRDGETDLSMTVLKPMDFNREASYPVIVFAHGSGSLQNVYKGWSGNYFREYMFNQYLARHGYVVIEVDFRHSTGYGRDFREDITNRMGHYETRDIVDALTYLDENPDYAGLDKVGVYGGSYGGFLALYAVSAAPERFHAAAALRPVTNWVNYYYANPWYTRPRLGHPDDNPGHYERSSPLSYAGSLSRPVLLLHGLTDDNVGFQDTVQYIDKLIKSANRNFDLMVYPSERHAFRDPNAWVDEYQRIFDFFEEHLKEN